MLIIKAFNLLFAKYFNSKKFYFNFSLLYLKRKRKYDAKYLDHIRLSTLELVAHEINTSNLIGAVAELGVYKGRFAKYINGYFAERKLYLFDTFNGFDQSDVQTDNDNNYSQGNQDFSDTTVKAVLEIMPHPEQCIVKQGFFPNTTAGVADDFVFVSIDTDLYDPIYNGLTYFYPRLVKGGYIFIHDYNNDAYLGAKQAVQKFCRENKISFVPLPDSCGTAIISK